MAINVAELLAKKNYAKAIEVIKDQLKAGKHNPQLHIQLADVLILSKKEREAIQILTRVADEFASEGFEAKAIAVLKKIDKLDPGRRDVQAKLSGLIRRPTAPVIESGPEIGLEEIGFTPASSGVISVPAEPPLAPPPPPRPSPVAPPPPRPAPAPEPELPSFVPPEASLDLAQSGLLDLGLDGPAPAPAPPKPPAAPRPAAPRAAVPPPPAPVQDLDFGGDEEDLPALQVEPVPEDEPVPRPLAPDASSAEDTDIMEIEDIQVEPEEDVAAAPSGAEAGSFDDQFTRELMSAIDEAFESAPASGAKAREEAGRGAVRGDFMRSPLFTGFDPDELLAILEGLTLLTFDAGDVILTQGALGHSLFILSTGTVKAWVKDEYGNYRMVRQLEEGSFFGEFAIVTGQPRAATITAATPCELLELDRGTLDAISIAHPHVLEVLREFHERRKKDR